jgi:4-carboxymuconolactone decarboxylase
MTDRVPDTAPPPAFTLRGGRFAPLTWDTMTPAQQAMTRSVLSGARGSMQGPYNVLLRSPELGDLAQRFGAHTRFHSSLPLALNELAILLVARQWTCQFVWWAHARIAADAGLPHPAIDAIAQGDRPEFLADDAAAVYAFCHTLLHHREVSDAQHAAVVARFGEAGVVDLMGTMSYYTLVCMSLNVDRYPLPDGAVVALKPLTQGIQEKKACNPREI